MELAGCGVPLRRSSCYTTTPLPRSLGRCDASRTRARGLHGGEEPRWGAGRRVVGGGLSEVETGVGGGVEWVVEEVVSSRGTEICDEPDHKGDARRSDHTLLGHDDNNLARGCALYLARVG